MRGWRVAWIAVGSSCALALSCGNATDASRAESSGAQGGMSGLGGRASVASAGLGGSTVGTAAGGDSGASSGGGSGGAGHGGSAGQTGSAGATCTPIAHERPALGTLSKDFAAISAAALGIYQVSTYYEQADSCAAMCAGKPAGPYLLIRREESSVRACTCASIADCQAQAQQAYCNASYQVDFTTAASDTVLSGHSGYIEWPGPNNQCVGAMYDVQLVELDASDVRLDGSGVYTEIPPVYDPQSGLNGCDETHIDNAIVGKACNRLQVLSAKRVASLP